MSHFDKSAIGNGHSSRGQLLFQRRRAVRNTLLVTKTQIAVAAIKPAR